jgi:formylglycine-generating enzyme required for sulfatase activity
MVRSALLVALLATGASSAADWPSLTRPLPEQGGGEKDAAVIIGVDNYAFVPKVAGAAQNARDWYSYLTRTQKVPPGRVRLLLDAEGTDTAMRASAKDAAGQVKPGGTLWFVFIGHGAPSEDGKDGILVGADAQQTVESLYHRSVRRKELLELLGRGPQAKTVVVLDACFSGQVGDGISLVKGLQPLLPVAKLSGAKLDRMVVMTAGASNQFAGPLPGAPRPAFSYLLLGALRGWGDLDRDGKVTAEEAVEYARDAIKTVVKDRRQTPELGGELHRAVLGRTGGERGPDLVSFVLGEASAPAVEPAAGGTEPAASGSLSVSVKPKDGARLELTDPQGKVLSSAAPFHEARALSGPWKVVARAAGFEDESRDVEVAPNEAAVVKLEMRLLGALKVTGKPSGAAVKVTGPAGYAASGPLPWEARGLKSGVYRVEVSRAGYEAADQQQTVDPGKTTTAVIELSKQAGPAPSPVTQAVACPAGMARVPGGTYVPADHSEPTTVASVCMDLTEVTVSQYALCISRGGCGAAGRDAYCNSSTSDRPNHPVNCVDYDQADSYCRWKEKRLPTSDEWEWAARGGAEARPYVWGDAAPGRQACWDGEGSDLGAGNRRSTCPVGSYPASDNPQGIHDLAGNLWEWTQTVQGPGNFVIRGGCWNTRDPAELRVSDQKSDPRSYKYDDLGFRCVRGQ